MSKAVGELVSGLMTIYPDSVVCSTVDELGNTVINVNNTTLVLDGEPADQMTILAESFDPNDSAEHQLQVMELIDYLQDAGILQNDEDEYDEDDDWVEDLITPLIDVDH